MRKVFLSTNMSLDGLLAGPNGEMDWLLDYAVSEAGWDYLHRLMRAVDTVLLGRNNYEGFYGYWAPMASNPGSPQREAEFSRWLNQAQKIVYSTTLPRAEWEHTTLYRSIEPDQVRQLKAQPGGDIVIMNSASVGRALLGMGLLDELWINLHPVVLGRGKPLFADLRERAKFALVEARASAYGVIECVYRKPEG